jgi:hypothetical protein
MIRAAFFTIMGMVLGVSICASTWFFATDCPPNAVLIAGNLRGERTAQIYVQDKLIWSGFPRMGGLIRFDMELGDGQFLIKVGDSTYRRGYVERADGLDHILAIGNDDVFYDSINRGILEAGRRMFACGRGR